MFIQMEGVPVDKLFRRTLRTVGWKSCAIEINGQFNLANQGSDGKLAF